MLRMRCNRVVAQKPEQDVVAAIAKANQEIKHIRDAMDAGENDILKRLVSMCPLDAIKATFENFTTSGSNSADKSLFLVPSISQCYAEVEASIAYVNDVLLRYQQTIVDLYIREYTVFSEDTSITSFNNKAFKLMLAKAIDYKQGQADAMVELGNEAGNADAPRHACTIA